MTDYGIDVSRWNTVTDWAAVRGNNITFTSVKITQGNYYTSPAAAGQVSGARDAGVTVGGYHFADPRNGAQANVDHFVTAARNLGVLGVGSFVPMLDIENSTVDGITWTPETANGFITDYLRAFRAATGTQQLAVYANLNFWQNLLRPDEWADDTVFLWLALYNGDPGNTAGFTHRRLALHQHTSHGTVPGITGHVDRNVTVNDTTLPTLTLGGTPTPPPPPPPAETYTVQPGNTLSGIAARLGLDWHDLARINHLSNPNRIAPGQVLRLR